MVSVGREECRRACVEGACLRGGDGVGVSACARTLRLPRMRMLCRRVCEQVERVCLRARTRVGGTDPNP